MRMPHASLELSVRLLSTLPPELLLDVLPKSVNGRAPPPSKGFSSFWSWE